MAYLTDDEINILQDFVNAKAPNAEFTLERIGKMGGVDAPTSFGAKVRATCSRQPGRIPFMRFVGHDGEGHPLKTPQTRSAI